MQLAAILLGLAIQSPANLTTTSAKVTASLALLGLGRKELRTQAGPASATILGNAVWVYGPWTPSPRMGFTCCFFHQDIEGDTTLATTLQHISGSVAKIHPKSLTLVDYAGRKVTPLPKDFCWTSNEPTLKALKDLNATDIEYFGQKKRGIYILAKCKVGGKDVFLFSRQIKGSLVIPAFVTGVQSFDPNNLDLFSYSVGACVQWHYTAGYWEEQITGPGSFADSSATRNGFC